jgi:inner membrane protein
LASPLLTAALPVVVSRAFAWPAGLERRVVIAAALCGVAPDLDVTMYAFGVRETETFGYRGFFHSLIASALLALFVGAVAFRSLGLGSRPWRRVVFLLFGAAAAHGLLDALTASDVGVALLSPFDRSRHFLPFALLPSCQMGLDEFLSYWGLLTIANETLYVLLPAALLVTFARKPDARRRLAVEAALWLGAVLVLRASWPDAFLARRARVIEPVGTLHTGDPRALPHADLPGGELVTRFDELRAKGLFDRALEPARSDVWSSSFFPSFLGGEAGRWRDGSPRLVWRTLAGAAPPSADEARAWLEASAAGDASARAQIFELAPTEKVDLALGRLTFPATRQALLLSHNRPGKPRYWSGRCNGVAVAAAEAPEPYRVVDVITKAGARVRFHPNDVKALLAVAYYETEEATWVGHWCDRVSFDPGATCSMSPAVVVLALVNRLGIAREPIVVDAVVSAAKQYYPVVGARVRVAREPYPPGAAPVSSALAGKVAELVDVDVTMTLSSTTQGYAVANVTDPAYPEGTAYRRVGVVPVVVRYAATLALDADSTLVGGRWTGAPPDGPDSILVARGGPRLLADGALAAADQIPWSFVRELARASVDAAPETPTVDLRTACDGRCR